MKERVRYLSFINIISILLLAICGLIDGIASRAVYFLAFLLPLLLSPVIFKKTDAIPLKFNTGRDKWALLLPLLFPSVLLIFLVSALTSLALSSLGFSDTVALTDGLLKETLENALLPAVLEEGLYRYIAISVLAPFSKRGAIIASTLFFAFAHCNLFQIPYAIIAGALFALFDVVCDSILPSLILHFTNNFLSIIFTLYFSECQYIFFILLLALSLVSLVFIALWRKKYASVLRNTFKDDQKPAFGFELYVFIAMTSFVAVTNLF